MPEELDNNQTKDSAVIDVELVKSNGANLSVTNKKEVLGRLISTQNSPSFFKQHFRLSPGMYVRPGEWVVVEAVNSAGRNVLILARVTDAREVNPHEDALSSNIREILPFASKYAEEGHSTVIYRIAEIEPTEEAVLDTEGNINSVTNVETLPKPGAAVRSAELSLKTRALGLEGNPDDGLHMGNFYGESDHSFVLNKSIVQRHIFICGGIGAGKSYSRGVLAEELVAWHVPQVNIDINGEMVDAAYELGGTNLVPGSGGLTLPLSALTAQDVLDAVPSIDPRSVMAELVRHAHEELLKESRRTGGHFLTIDLVNKIEAIGPELEAKKASILPAKSRVQSLERLPYLGEPFDWQKALKPGAFINIDCRGFLVSDLRVIVASIARDLQRLARAKKIPFVVFSIDEAHLVAPANEDTVCLQVLRELARIGRHYKIGLVLTTQSPQDLDRSILKRLLTRFLHAIEPDQLDALRGVFSDASHELIRQLPKMPQGSCVVTGAYETIRHATMVQIRQRVSTHGGGTPDIWPELSPEGRKDKNRLIIF